MAGEIGGTADPLGPGFRVRDVVEADRSSVREMTANTWEFGDYINLVFDDWLGDTRGRFIVAEDVATGQIAGIDKMTFLSPSEAWFEGLRVAPEFRGQGLASMLQTYMIEQVTRAGATRIRLLTSISNKAVQRMAFRDGFALRGLVTFWKWTPDIARPPSSGPNRIRRADKAEAYSLYEGWLRSSAYLTAGLCHRNWSYSETNREEWEEAARQGRLLTTENRKINDAIPAPTVLLTESTTDEGNPLWIVAAAAGLGEEWEQLLSGLLAFASQNQVGEVNGLFPRDPYLEAALAAAGFRVEEDEEPLCLFERRA